MGTDDVPLLALPVACFQLLWAAALAAAVGVAAARWHPFSEQQQRGGDLLCEASVATPFMAALGGLLVAAVVAAMLAAWATWEGLKGERRDFWMSLKWFHRAMASSLVSPAFPLALSPHPPTHSLSLPPTNDKRRLDPRRRPPQARPAARLRPLGVAGDGDGLPRLRDGPGVEAAARVREAADGRDRRRPRRDPSVPGPPPLGLSRGRRPRARLHRLGLRRAPALRRGPGLGRGPRPGRRGGVGRAVPLPGARLLPGRGRARREGGRGGGGEAAGRRRRRGGGEHHGCRRGGGGLFVGRRWRRGSPGEALVVAAEPPLAAAVEAAAEQPARREDGERRRGLFFLEPRFPSLSGAASACLLSAAAAAAALPEAEDALSRLHGRL